MKAWGESARVGSFKMSLPETQPLPHGGFRLGSSFLRQALETEGGTAAVPSRPPLTRLWPQKGPPSRSCCSRCKTASAAASCPQPGPGPGPGTREEQRPPGQGMELRWGGEGGRVRSGPRLAGLPPAALCRCGTHTRPCPCPSAHACWYLVLGFSSPALPSLKDTSHTWASTASGRGEGSCSRVQSQHGRRISSTSLLICTLIPVEMVIP